MNNLFCLAAALGMGLLLSRVVKKLNLPDVTGFLIAGLIIGPYCLGVFNGESLEAVSDITAVALGFIAFSIGGEFKKENLKRVGMKAFVITVFQAMAAVILVDVVLILVGFDIPLSITLGAIATATAPAATLMVVRQYKAHGKMTNTLLSVVAMDDAIGLAVFSISLAIAQSLTSGATPTVNNMLLQPLLEIVLSLLIGFAIGAIVSICIRFFKSRANRLCITIASVLLGVALSNMLGLSSLLLCMSIGAAVVNLRSDADTILEGAERWTTPLFMLFFVISGAELDLTVLTSVGLLGLIYIVSRSIGKYFGAYLGARIVKSEPSIQKYLGLTLLPQAGVAIGMAQIVISQLPEYGAQIRAVVLCATLIYELVGPVLTRIALVKSGEIEHMPKQKKVKKGELKAG